MKSKINLIVTNLVVIALCLVSVTGSALVSTGTDASVRAYSRPMEFDFVAWILNAFWVKATQSALELQRYVPPQKQHDLVVSYANLVQQANELQGQISQIYADPSVKNPGLAAAALNGKLGQLDSHLQDISPVVETILQNQVATVLASEGLTLGGQPIPPVLYHVTPLPYALIVSPLSVIREIADISLNAGLTLPQREMLENEVSKGLNVSALTVPVGGIGIYPTMVMQTSDLPYLAETISHEWTHNFLTLRPLGLSYDVSPALRTMNETTATISGDETGSKVIQRFYPELVPPAPPSSQGSSGSPPAKPAFDFNVEMHTTRVEVDKLLKEGKITQAEQYMNARRLVFLQHGYVIRKLNQAYFAFYGAYAAVPQGAAGADPVGPAVQKLRSESSSLAAFLNRISWMTSFVQLQRAVQQ